MNAEELKVFQTITLNYFAKLSPETSAPVLEESYLLFESPLMLDYTSWVGISGVYEGCVYLTVSSSMIEQLLRLHGEAQRSELTRMDMCRELSNTLSGNANRVFGESWKISVPQSVATVEREELPLPASTFVMPFSWSEAQACLVIGLQRKSG